MLAKVRISERNTKLVWIFQSESANHSRHAELVSASVRGEGIVKAHSEILKFAIEREQSQACLNYAERKQIERS